MTLGDTVQAESHRLSPVFSRLDRLRVVTGKSWEQVAELLQIDRSMFFHVKAGRRNLSKKALFRLEAVEREAGILPADQAPAFREIAAEPLRGAPQKKLTISRAVPQTLAPDRRCRVYGMAQCAARGFRIGDVIPEREEDLEQVPVPAAIARVKRLAAFRAVDDSMDPLIHDGDIVFFNPAVELRDGEVALVKFRDQVACKRVAVDRERERLLLMSYAPGVRTIEVKGADVEWAYPVLGAMTISVRTWGT